MQTYNQNRVKPSLVAHLQVEHVLSEAIKRIECQYNEGLIYHFVFGCSGLEVKILAKKSELSNREGESCVNLNSETRLVNHRHGY